MAKASVSQVRHGASGSGGGRNLAEGPRVSVSHESRGRRVELTLSSLIRTLASQNLGPGRDLRPRHAEVESNADMIGSPVAAQDNSQPLRPTR
jgi:hypothetical protein